MSLVTLKSRFVLATLLATTSTAFASSSPITPLPGGGPHVAALASPITPLPGGGPHVVA